MLNLQTLNRTLLLSSKNNNSLGLDHGKMRLSLYFFYIGRKSDNKEYLLAAEKLLDDIFENIKTLKKIDIKDGLSGIGLGVHYLIKNKYVEGNINHVLEDIDNEIIKQLSYPRYYTQLTSSSLIPILYYLCLRLEDQKVSSENNYIYQEIIIQTVNYIYQQINSDFFNESLSYNIEECRLPLFLAVLSKLHKLQFYNNRVTKILEELSYHALSTIPILNANKLLLLWAINLVNKEIELENWARHITLLKNSLNIFSIFNDELRDKNIFFQDGISSIYLIIKDLKELFTDQELNTISDLTFSKIESSGIWNLLQAPQYLSKYGNLPNIFCIIPTLYFSDNKECQL
ncbi:hypothetical protein CLV62_10623 [Dysgonomonas alginatilytica]|uniref:Lanthionine synthetase-like protein n=1 Tax=Dysgonomonas alginatilytica TaxID=1605892 RepID=A0A2V3PT51_9BACT|nr:hypothetical protein [Dysgonomonas alginatilytica]PXV65850.1 hypothetical protein CLV62_10623 [Dysgonomonas alginatilytica]